MPRSREEYTDANRAAWNEAASRHAAHNNARLFAAFEDPDYLHFDGDILQTLLQVGVEGKSVIQLCCNNAAETVALARLGAARCVGVDAAEEFLAHGAELIEIAGVGERVESIHSDVYDLPRELCGGFDIVLTTVGVLGWMPDLEGFFRVIQGLLKPGGSLVMEEMHPVLLMYEPDTGSGISSIRYSYFSDEVWEETAGLYYYGGETYAAKPSYSFMHRLDRILMAGIDSGLALRQFRELDYDISLFCTDLEHSPTPPPLGFVMVMRNETA